jgi:hypothetical protein
MLGRLAWGQDEEPSPDTLAFPIAKIRTETATRIGRLQRGHRLDSVRRDPAGRGGWKKGF